MNTDSYANKDIPVRIDKTDAWNLTYQSQIRSSVQTTNNQN